MRKRKPGITIEIPNFGSRTIHTIVSDYTGTLACGGKLAAGVRKRLRRLLRRVDVHVVTADSFGTAANELRGIVEPRVLPKGRHDTAKERIVKGFDLAHVAAFGNGNNDRRMLRAVKSGGGLAISVDNGEGCSLEAMLGAHLHIVGAKSALDLLLEPTRCKATLRF
ncbi:MAG TPA: ATPase P [Casimicrobiaceae bacterium]|nr:ATPase P [Casimicrobiaceae bacterium]